MSRVSWGNHRNDGVVWGIERKADLIGKKKKIKSVSGFEKKKKKEKYSCIYTNGVYPRSLV